MKYIVILAGVVLCTRTDLAGQDTAPIQTDRPDQTETPFTVPQNHFQMETGFSYEQTDAATKTIAAPSVLLKYGLSDNFEVGVIAGYTTIKTNQTISGLNPVTLRFKQKIADEKGLLPLTTIIGYLTIPKLASEPFKVTYYAPGFKFSMQNTVSDFISVGYNLGALWDGVSAEPTFLYSLSVGYALTDKLSGFTELYGFAPQLSKADHRFNCGLSYLLQSNISVDASGGAGITDNAPRYFLSGGFSFRLKD